MFHTPVVAALYVSSDLRRQGQHLVPQLRELADHHGGAGWILKLLMVLDREPVMVLEPAAKRGFVGTTSGVADNFQLHMLLMDLLPAASLFSWLRGGRLPKDLAALAKGTARSNSTIP